LKLTQYLHVVSRSKNAWSYTSIPPIRIHGVVLVKHRENFNILPLLDSDNRVSKVTSRLTVIVNMCFVIFLFTVVFRMDAGSTSSIQGGSRGSPHDGKTTVVCNYHSPPCLVPRVRKCLYLCSLHIPS